MKVLLVNSPLGRSQPNIYPLGLAYLATSIKSHELAGFDAALSATPFQDLSNMIDTFVPDVIGISLRNIDTLTSSNIYSYFSPFVQTVKHIKEHHPNVTVVVGGAGFSLFGQEIMERVSEIDYGILLEGEKTFPELLNNLDEPQHIEGVYFRTGGKVIFKGNPEPLEFGRIPIPDREIFDVSQYRHPFSVGVQTKRGCVFECIYCTYPYLTGRNVRVRTAESVGEELENLNKNHNIREIFFADNVFNFPLEHAEGICKEIIKRELNLKWTAYFSEKFINREFVKLALEAGCEKFVFAPDGYNDVSLKKLGKGIRRKDLERTYDLMEELGAKFSCGFIWNQPNTKFEDLVDLISLVFRLVRMNNLEGLGFTTMRILPKTRLYGIALREGYLAPENQLIEPIYFDPPPLNTITWMVKLLRKIISKVRTSSEQVAT